MQIYNTIQYNTGFFMFLVESSYFTYDWMLNLLSHQIKNGFAKKKKDKKKIYTIHYISCTVAVSYNKYLLSPLFLPLTKNSCQGVWIKKKNWKKFLKNFLSNINFFYTSPYRFFRYNAVWYRTSLVTTSNYSLPLQPHSGQTSAVLPSLSAQFSNVP